MFRSSKPVPRREASWTGRCGARVHFAMRWDLVLAYRLPSDVAINDEEDALMDARKDEKKSGADDSSARDRSIPRGTDEHADPNTQQDDDRSATTRPRSGTRDENDAELDL